MMQGQLPRSSRLARWWMGACFVRHRADYYDYLADRMALGHGSRTLRDIFQLDAARYAGSLRGRLSLEIRNALERQGGGLAEALSGLMPAVDCHLIRIGQQSGVEALEQTLRDLARLGRFLQQSRQLVWSTLSAALLAWSVLMGVLLAIPLFTAPRIAQAFQSLPLASHGAQAQRFFAVAGWLEQYLLFVLLAGSGLLLAGVMSLPRWSGLVRRRLDAWMPWRLYRNLQSMRFLSLLAVVARKRTQVSVALRRCIEVQQTWANPWLAAHLDQMLRHIDNGVVGAETLDTGLIDRPLMWYLTDLIDTHGLDEALQCVQLRLHRQTFDAVARRATRFKWGLLLSAVLSLLSLLFWHFSVVDELRRGLIYFYSNP